MLKDRNGNELHEGQVVFWTAPGVLAKIKRIDDGRIVIEVGFTLDPKKRIGDFILTTDPEESRHVESILAKATKDAVQ